MARIERRQDRADHEVFFDAAHRGADELGLVANHLQLVAGRCERCDFGEAGADKARTWLADNHYDAVLIGAGLRLVAGNTLLFESIVNAAHTAQPGCRFVFNRAAVATPDDIRRWYPHPEAVSR